MSAHGGGRGGMGGGRGGGGGRMAMPGFWRGGAQWDGQRANKESRGRNLRGLLELLRPYRLRVAAMLAALIVGTAASLAPPLLAKVAIDEGIERHDTHTLVLVVLAFLLSALVVWAMTYLQTYLVGWSASARSPTCASASSPTCSASRSASTRAAPRGC